MATGSQAPASSYMPAAASTADAVAAASPPAVRGPATGFCPARKLIRCMRWAAAEKAMCSATQASHAASQTGRLPPSLPTAA